MKHPPPHRQVIPDFRPDPVASDRLVLFRDLLLRWTVRINLIAEREPTLVDARHISDCLQLVPLLPAEGALADLGSGGGLPGLVFAINNPDREVHLIESDRRKAAFLLDAAARLGLLHVHVHAVRIADAQHSLPPLAAVSARALAPLADLIGFAHEMLPPKGVAIFPKGRTAEQELTQALGRWQMSVERFRSRTDADSTIFRLSEIRRAPE
ncbi:MAG TPA: 16S rRNA (guanine(527)-N(7))-methyltransferase RsmG [Acetobacteraceae bacterium]|nr:16S rRNA (guanine(527)-N(7))-methyltransferase RsmG [Acetobacteraceae bacterium]